MAYATFEEMATLRPGRIDTADMARAEALLEEASALVDEAAGVEAVLLWSQPLAVIPAAVKSVTIQVALRVFENPTGLTMEQATGYMYQRGQSHVTGLELTKSEKARIKRAAGKASAYSVRLAPAMDEADIETVFALDELT